MPSSEPSPHLPALRPGLHVTDLAGEALVYNPATTKAHWLDATGAAVLRRCDGATDLGEAASDLAAGSDLPAEAAREAVQHHLVRLHRAGLLDSAAPRPQGPSRRQFLQRWGTAAAVLLPVMASLAAPTPAFAQSLPKCINSSGTGCQDVLGLVRLSVCIPCNVGGVCTIPNKYCVSVYVKGGTSCLDDTVVSVGCVVMNGSNVQTSCAAARAAVGNGSYYYCCQCP